MGLTKLELENYRLGIRKTIDLNMKLLSDGVIEPRELTNEIQQLEELEEKIVLEINTFRKEKRK